MRILVVALVVQLALGAGVVVMAVNGFPMIGGGGDVARERPAAGPPAPAPAARLDRFDADRAFRLIREQVAVGQRPAGSARLRALAERLRARLPGGRFEPVPGHPGLRNVVGVLPGHGPAVVVGAHYDTEVRPRGFVGANDGAAGTAAVVELARALAALPRPANAREIRFVLFDGEEPPHGLPEEQDDFYNTGLRGSRAYVRAHPERTAAAIVLDYVGNKGLTLPREANSDRRLWSVLRSSARGVGKIRYFPRGTASPYVDDHAPFIRAGVPAIDLIDPNYEGHSLTDGIDRLSRRSLDAVGETIVALALRLR